MTRQGTFRSLTAALAVLTLSGCVSEETASRMFVEPDRYQLYSCPELATAAQAKVIRQRELEALMAKAGTDAGGRLASSMAYQPEYAQLRGEMDQIRKTAAERNCKTTPSAGGLGVRSSDQVIR
jgi:hypothetical protein